MGVNISSAYVGAIDSHIIRLMHDGRNIKKDVLLWILTMFTQIKSDADGDNLIAGDMQIDDMHNSHVFCGDVGRRYPLFRLDDDECFTACCLSLQIVNRFQ